jgi:crotonobetainyl-CoA:carnitine CoA-transferase CaiB-like acyl-CoA transferase
MRKPPFRLLRAFVFSCFRDFLTRRIVGKAVSALSHLRICDFTGQLAGAGATRLLAAFGAEVIRVEDPVTRGGWDILRGMSPFVDERRGIELGGGFQNHNVEKLGITLNLRTERGRALLGRLVAISDVVAENFAAGVLARLGFPYDVLRAIRPDVVYVSHSGFGHRGPYASFKTWGPIVQAICGLSVTSGLPDLPPAGWGYSYMDHQGANLMALAILAALVHRGRTGEGQWIDMSCTDAGASLLGPVVLDATVNGRPFRRPGMPHSNRGQSPAMSPHGIYPSRGDDCWIAIACRDDRDWRAMVDAMADQRLAERRFDSLSGRLAAEDELDAIVGSWTRERDKFGAAAALQAVGVPAAAVQTPRERIDEDPATGDWGLWPVVDHPRMGRVRVDGLPAHLSSTDWRIERAAPLLGQHNGYVYGELLGLSQTEIDDLRGEGVL